MEVSVYLSLDARRNNKPVFKRAVSSPDVFEYDAFVRIMRSIFGNNIVVEFLIC